MPLNVRSVIAAAVASTFLVAGIVVVSHQASSSKDSAVDAAPRDQTTDLALGKILWLPLGDSITFGCGSTNEPLTKVISFPAPLSQTDGAGFMCPSECGGYRIPTANIMTERGHTVTTMGTMESGPTTATELQPVAAKPQWLKHEGHPGWRIDMIDAYLPKSLASSPVPPDIVTIHLGTNDCWGAKGGAYPCSAANPYCAPHTPQDLVNRMNALLTNVFHSLPNANVFVSSIIWDPGYPVGSWNAVAQCTYYFNTALPGIVNAFKTAGKKVHYVPMVENAYICGVDASHMNMCCEDQIHPVQTGYNGMAAIWAKSLMEAGY